MQFNPEPIEREPTRVFKRNPMFDPADCFESPEKYKEFLDAIFPDETPLEQKAQESPNQNYNPRVIEIAPVYRPKAI